MFLITAYVPATLLSSSPNEKFRQSVSVATLTTSSSASTQCTDVFYTEKSDSNELYRTILSECGQTEMSTSDIIRIQSRTIGHFISCPFHDWIGPNQFWIDGRHVKQYSHRGVFSVYSTSTYRRNYSNHIAVPFWWRVLAAASLRCRYSV